MFCQGCCTNRWRKQAQQKEQASGSDQACSAPAQEYSLKRESGKEHRKPSRQEQGECWLPVPALTILANSSHTTG